MRNNIIICLFLISLSTMAKPLSLVNGAGSFKFQKKSLNTTLTSPTDTVLPWIFSRYTKSGLLDIGIANDTVMPGGAAIQNIGRLSTRYYSALNSGFMVGSESYVNQTTSTIGSIQALEGFAHVSNRTGTVNLAIGTIGNTENTGGGNIQWMRGVQGGNSIRSKGGATHAAVFYASPNGQVGNGQGLIENGYGLYINFFGNGYRKKYGIYSVDSNASNFFAGPIVSNKGIQIGNQSGANNQEAALTISSGNINLSSIITPKGSVGAQTINTISGTVNIGSGQNTIQITNSLVSENSLVFAVIRSDDATAQIKNVVPASGVFTIHLAKAASKETSIGFFVINK